MENLILRFRVVLIQVMEVMIKAKIEIILRMLCMIKTFRYTQPWQ